MPEDLRGAPVGCEPVAVRLAARSSASGPGSAGLRHRGFSWCGISLKTIIAGPDITELVLVNWDSQLTGTPHFPILSTVVLKCFPHNYVVVNSMESLLVFLACWSSVSYLASGPQFPHR